MSPARAAAAALGLAWIALVLLVVRSFPFDDTFITLRYAENLALHGHPSFNLDDRVDGYTSPGWMLLMALVVRLGLDAERAATVLSLGFGLGGVLLAARLARELGASRLAAFLVAGGGTLTTAGWIVWSACGMETPFVGVCVLLLLVAYMRGGAMSWPRATMLIIAAAARPECVVLVALLLARDGWLLLRAGDRAARLRGLAVAALLVAGFVAHWLYYGKPLPNTYYAKLAGPSPVGRGILEVGRFLVSHGVGLGLIASILVARLERRVRFVALAFLTWAFATFVAYALAGGDYLDYHRFYQPIVPPAFAMLAAALRWPRLAPREPAIAIALGLALIVHGVFTIRPARANLALGSAALYVEKWRKGALALARHYAPSTSMAVRSAGILPYLTRFRTLDLLGLSSREIALHPGIVNPDDPGHNKAASPSQIVAWQPDLIVGHPIFRDRDESGAALPSWTPPEIAQAGYRWRCLPVEAGSWLCLFERPGAVRKLEHVLLP